MILVINVFSRRHGTVSSRRGFPAVSLRPALREREDMRCELNGREQFRACVGVQSERAFPKDSDFDSIRA